MSRPVPVATFLPFNPQVFVAANSNAVLRLVHVGNGMVLQKLKAHSHYYILLYYIIIIIYYIIYII